MKALILQLPPVLRYLVPFRSTYLPQQSVVKTLSSAYLALLNDIWSMVRDTWVTLSLCSLLNVRDPLFVPI